MTFVSAVLSNSFKLRITSLFSMNLSRLFHCSVIKVLCIVVFATAFIFYQKHLRLSTTFLLYLKVICFCCVTHATACIYYHRFLRLSTTFLSFKLFFSCAAPPRQLLDNTISPLHCQHFFTYFFTFYSCIFSSCQTQNRCCGFSYMLPQHLLFISIFQTKILLKFWTGRYYNIDIAKYCSDQSAQ